MYLGSRRVRYAHKGGSGRSKEICKSGRYLCQVRYVCKSSFTPLFLHTTTGLRHNFYTEHCFFFLWVSLVGMEQDLLSFFCNRRRS